MLTIDKIYEAQKVINEMNLETPMLQTTIKGVDGNIYLKCENLQQTGSFKLRGAAFFMSQIPDEEKHKGVVAWSAGNHAQGVAKAAQLNDLPATIFIPITGSLTKIENTRSYGAEVVLSNGLLDVAHVDALAFQKQTGAIAVPPYDDENIIAGQATVGLEILSQVPNADAVVVPIGGGGLIAGIAYAIKTLNPTCKIYGVEACEAASALASRNKGEIVKLTDVNTIADGIAVKSPGVLNFEIIESYVDDIVTVTDDEMSDAILELMEKNHVIVEGAGAAAYAALMLNKIPKHDNVVCLLSGGNLDVTLLNKIVQKSLRRQNRIMHLALEIEDKPGSLLEIVNILAQHQGNILSIDHTHSAKGIPIKHCIANIEFEMTSINNLIKLEEVLLKTFGKFELK